MTKPDIATADDLVITERIAASPDAVFAFLVDPEKLVRWIGNAVDVEPEPGGKFAITVGQNVASGRYLTVDPPNRVVFTWGWEGSADVPPGSSTVSINVTQSGNDSLVELRHADLPGGSGDDHKKGWSHILPRLAAIIEGRDPGPELPHADQAAAAHFANTPTEHSPSEEP